MVSFFYSYFELFIENLVSKCVFSLQFIIFKLMPYLFFHVTSLWSFLSCFSLIQDGFCHFTCILHLYIIHFDPSINTSTTDYGIFNHQLLVFTIVLPWIGLSSHEYPHLESTYCLLILMLQLSQVQGNPFSYFSRQMEPLFGLFLQAIPLQDSPPLWSFFRPSFDSLKIDLTSELTCLFKIIKNT